MTKSNFKNSYNVITITLLKNITKIVFFQIWVPPPN